MKARVGDWAMMTPRGVVRDWGLVGWGGDGIRRMLRRQQRSAMWAFKRRAIARAVRQALGLVRPL